MRKFRKIEISIGYARIAGCKYKIEAKYKGRNVTAYTNDSELFDYMKDDSNKKLHHQAKRSCYNYIVNAYNCDIGNKYECLY